MLESGKDMEKAAKFYGRLYGGGVCKFSRLCGSMSLPVSYIQLSNLAKLLIWTCFFHWYRWIFAKCSASKVEKNRGKVYTSDNPFQSCPVYSYNSFTASLLVFLPLFCDCIQISDQFWCDRIATQSKQVAVTQWYSRSCLTCHTKRLLQTYDRDCSRDSLTILREEIRATE